MKTCEACSASLRPAAQFCTRCGTAVALPARDVPATSPADSPVDNPAGIPVASGVDSFVGIPVDVAVALAVAQPIAAPVEDDTLEPAPLASHPLHTAFADIPARVPSRRRVAPPRARSKAATWALVTGVVPLAVSIIGNLATVPLREPGGAMPLVAVIIVGAVFIVNAALLTLCAVTGFRALRETSNGITRGRPLAIAGLVAGGVNLVLWASGFVVAVVGFVPALI